VAVFSSVACCRIDRHIDGRIDDRRGYIGRVACHAIDNRVRSYRAHIGQGARCIGGHGAVVTQARHPAVSAGRQRPSDRNLRRVLGVGLDRDRKRGRGFAHHAVAAVEGLHREGHLARRQVRVFDQKRTATRGRKGSGMASPHRARPDQIDGDCRSRRVLRIRRQGQRQQPKVLFRAAPGEHGQPNQQCPRR
jgi:hypothetical protein